MLPEDDLKAPPRSRQLGRVLLFVFVLVLSSSWWLGVWKEPLNQNRELAKPPPLGAHMVFDMDGHKKAEAFWRDYLPISRLTIPAVAGVGNRAGYSLRSQVWQGRDDELFLGADFDVPCRTDIDFAILAEFLDTPPALGNDPRIRFVSPPDKSAVMSDRVWGGELLGSDSALTECQRRQSTLLNGLERQHERAITTVPGITETARYFQEPGYFLGDSHWTPAGAAALALQLGTWISPAVPLDRTLQLRFMAKTNKVVWGGGLSRLVGLARAETSPVIETRFQRSRVTEITPTDPAVVLQSRAPGAPLGGRTLLYVDSFFEAAKGTVSPLFTDLTVIQNTLDLRQYLAGHVGQFDHIIVLAVQRQTASMFLLPAHDLVKSLSPTRAVSWRYPKWPELPAGRVRPDPG